MVVYNGHYLVKFQRVEDGIHVSRQESVLRGTNQSELTWMSGKLLSKKFNQQDAYVASICCMVPYATLHLMQSSADSGMGENMELQALLEEYADVFEEPKTLPPHRSFDLKYHSGMGTGMLMLDPIGVIRPSHSPFSSLIVMVKNKDGSWRMCIDYRQINKFTIKDKFPIPVIEELIDELQGAQVFSKLDLRSGYHQIRMKEEDVYKTTFRSHEGHYEFVVMPFGLTNAHSTFQALMNLMRHNTLFAKKSKCVFGTSKVEYLGHVISSMGVATDPSKIKAMQDWHVPTNIKQLIGFLGLTGYYRRFVKGYAVISQPLTALLKKNAFQWNLQTQTAFDKLMQAMVNSPVLALPNFEEEFIIETDASGVGIGAVLQQHGHPVAYLSKTLATKHQSLYAYEKELLAVVMDLQKWRGFDYEIEYKKGKDNVVADALSRVERPAELFSLLTSGVSNELMDDVINTWIADDNLQKVVAGLRNKTLTTTKYEWVNGQFLWKGKWVVGKDEALRTKLIAHFHDSVVGGHSGVYATTKRLTTFFYWKGLRKMVKHWVRKYDVCQRNKSDLSAYPGKTAILVVVDRLSKQAHFMPLAHPYNASQVAQLFLDHIYKLHGLPKSIVSDRVKIFTSLFWKSLFEKLQVKWLPLAEYWYNTNFHSSINTTPYEVVFGQPPPLHIPYVAKDNNVEAVDRTLQAREQTIQLLKFNLKKAQDRIKSQADKKRSEREFKEGDWVYLKLQPYRQLIIRQGRQNKFLAKFFGPFQVIKKVGAMAYKLQLPSHAMIHPVFHVSQIKACHSDVQEMRQFPQCDTEGLIAATPFKLLERRMAKQGNRAVVFGLI
ncbi:putative mitochondrial protein [Tanacetum coccineum]